MTVRWRDRNGVLYEEFGHLDYLREEIEKQYGPLVRDNTEAIAEAARAYVKVAPVARVAEDSDSEGEADMAYQAESAALRALAAAVDAERGE